MIFTEVEHLTLWFHDSIYIPGATENEKASAAFMQALLCQTPMRPDILHDAERGILATALHTKETCASEVAVLLDLDTCHFSWDEPDYERADDLIREELEPIYGVEAYRVGRAKFLEGLLARSALYRSRQFVNAFESKARVNLLRTVDRLHAMDVH